jgi:hypothetical protein
VIASKLFTTTTTKVLIYPLVLHASPRHPGGYRIDEKGYTSVRVSLKKLERRISILDIEDAAHHADAHQGRSRREAGSQGRVRRCY